MILKASQRGGGMQLARPLLNDRDNDHVTLHELRGFIADDLAGAFKEAQAISRATKCRQFLFSVSLNPPELADVPVEVFEAAIEAIEKKVGLTGQPRALVFHEKNGRRHAHCVWSRIDSARMRAINLPHFKYKLQDVSRELFMEHGWDMPAGLRREGDSDPLNYQQAEGQQAKRANVDPQVLKSLFLKCWQGSDSATAFAAALWENGFVLARGDRRGYVAVDHEGEIYSLSRWLGKKRKDLKTLLGDPKTYSSVGEALAIFIGIENLEEPIREVQGLDELVARAARLESRRIGMSSKHRQIRNELRASQVERRVEVQKEIKTRLPAGWKALLSRLQGRYSQLFRQAERELSELDAQF